MGESNPMVDDSVFGLSYMPQSLLWDQWWSTDQLDPLASSEYKSSTANNLDIQTGPLLDGFMYRYNANPTGHWNDNVMTNYTDPWSGPSSVTKYTAPSPEFEPMGCEELPPVQHPPPTLKKPNRKRKRNSDDLPPRKAARRGSLDGENTCLKDSTVRESNPSGNRAHSAQQHDGSIKVIQERNRIASNKFRAKKNEDLLRLKASEQDIRRVHRELSACVADLTLEVYELKMQLLQHSGCDCALIQRYLAHESQRYVQVLDEKSQQEASQSSARCEE